MPCLPVSVGAVDIPRRIRDNPGTLQDVSVRFKYPGGESPSKKDQIDAYYGNTLRLTLPGTVAVLVLACNVRKALVQVGTIPLLPYQVRDHAEVATCCGHESGVL